MRDKGNLGASPEGLNIKARKRRSHQCLGRRERRKGQAQAKKKPHTPPILSAGHTTGNKTDVFPACVEFTVRREGRGIKRESRVIIEVQTGINVVKGKSKGELWGSAGFSGEWHFCRAAHPHWDANEEPPPPRGNAEGEGDFLNFYH